MLASKSMQGVISESFRLLPNSQRSFHPINSYVVLGRKSDAFLEVPIHGCTWSQDSILGWFAKHNVCCVALGLPWAHAFTPIHHAEYIANVPYRYEKNFSGKLINLGVESAISETLFVQPTLFFIKRFFVHQTLVVHQTLFAHQTLLSD